MTAITRRLRRARALAAAAVDVVAMALESTTRDLAGGLRLREAVEAEEGITALRALGADVPAAIRRAVTVETVCATDEQVAAFTRILASGRLNVRDLTTLTSAAEVDRLADTLEAFHD